jgi:hypothetical protein
MLEELWAKFRVVDKWPETRATVTTVDRAPAEGRAAAKATITFNYRPSEGDIQSGTFFIGNQSSLYNLDENDTFPIRYNPTRPERFFSSEYTIPFWWKWWAVLIGAFAAVFLYVFFVGR